MFWKKQDEPAQSTKSYRYADGSADQCQQEILNPQLLLNLPTRGAKCHPRCYFRRAPQHAHQGQAGQIRAGNQQNESRGQHQSENLRPQCGRLAFLERNGIVRYLGAWVVSQFIAVRAMQPCAIDLAICLWPRGAITQASNAVEVCPPAFALASGLQRSIHIGVQRRGCVFREHADNGVGLASQKDRPANDVRIGIESFAP